MTAVDLWLMQGGYLRSPDGRYRWVCGLDSIARNLQRNGIRVTWGEPPNGKLACCYWWRDHIVLSPRLFEADAETLRAVLIHEAGHALRGRSEHRVRVWQRWLYPEMAWV